MRGVVNLDRHGGGTEKETNEEEGMEERIGGVVVKNYRKLEIFGGMHGRKEKEEGKEEEEELEKKEERGARKGKTGENRGK